LVEAQFGPSDLTRRGLIGLVLLAGISAPFPLLSVGYPWPVGAAVLLVCVAAAVTISRLRTNDRGFPSSEAALLEDFIQATFSESRAQIPGPSVQS